MICRLGRTAIFFYGLDVEIWPKSGVPHHPGIDPTTLATSEAMKLEQALGTKSIGLQCLEVNPIYFPTEGG